MAAFVYKFNTVKKVKEQLKKKKEKELAEVELEIKETGKKIVLLENDLDNVLKSFQTTNMKVSTIQFKKSSENILKNKIEQANKELKKLHTKKQLVISELEQKSKEHKIFGILEDNMRDKFNFEQNKIENGKIDEIAVQKFARGRL
jgi:flagellar export protein FliJ